MKAETFRHLAQQCRERLRKGRGEIVKRQQLRLWIGEFERLAAGLDRCDASRGLGVALPKRTA
jgi:hypothetical protein